MTFIHLDCFGRFAIDGRNKVIKLYGPLSVIVIFCFFKEKPHFDPLSTTRPVATIFRIYSFIFKRPPKQLDKSTTERC